MESETSGLTQAKIQFGERVYLITISEKGPPWYVVTQESGPSNALFCDVLNHFANMKHFDQRHAYVAHEAYTMAQRMERHLDGKLIWYSKPEPSSGEEATPQLVY